MNIDGTYKSIGYNKEIVIKGDVISYPLVNGSNEETVYELTEEHYSFIEGRCYGLKKGYSNLFVYHEELYNEKMIRILSSCAFEYDGRGLILMNEYIHEEDLEYVDKDFISRLKEHLNNREHSSMTIVDRVPAMGMMGMEMMNAMNSKTDISIIEDDPWDCECGYHNDNGKFCANCGAKRK